MCLCGVSSPLSGCEVVVVPYVVSTVVVVTVVCVAFVCAV